LVAVTALDAEAIRAHAVALSDLRSGALDDAGAAAAIERDCVARWAEALRRTRAIRSPGTRRELVRRLVSYFERRDYSARLLAAGMRGRDAAKVAEAKAAWAEADRLITEFVVARSGREP